jgi:hypothetical protein
LLYGEEGVRFVRVYFWEYVQNIAFLVGFVWSLRFFREDQFLIALIILVGSSFITAVIIRWTERYIANTHHETVQATIANGTYMTIAGVIMVLYMNQISFWWADIVVAGVIGGGFGFFQIYVQKQSFQEEVDHAIAFFLAAGISLLSLRFFLNFNEWVAAIVVNAILTLIIVIVDYWPRIKSELA